METQEISGQDKATEVGGPELTATLPSSCNSLTFNLGLALMKTGKQSSSSDDSSSAKCTASSAQPSASRSAPDGMDTDIQAALEHDQPATSKEEHEKAVDDDDDDDDEGRYETLPSVRHNPSKVQRTRDASQQIKSSSNSFQENVNEWSTVRDGSEHFEGTAYDDQLLRSFTDHDEADNTSATRASHQQRREEEYSEDPLAVRSTPATSDTSSMEEELRRELATLKAEVPAPVVLPGLVISPRLSAVATLPGENGEAS